METVGEIYGTDRRFRGLWALEFGIGGKGVQRDKRLDGRHIFMEYSLYDYVEKRHGWKQSRPTIAGLLAVRIRFLNPSCVSPRRCLTVSTTPPR